MTASLALVGDIGGTNARFALVSEGSTDLQHLQRLVCAEYETLQEAISSYLQSTGLEVDPTRACLAIACPITGDVVDMPNNPWTFSLSALKSELGLEELQAINDFISIAHCIPTLGKEDVLQIGGGDVVAGMPKTVLGAGTGLGVAGLVPSGNGWVPFATEGGHVDFAPNSSTEAWILRMFQEEYEHVSAERILSGPGLEELYLAVATIQNKPQKHLKAADITAEAQEDNASVSYTTLRMFCAMLGSFAGNAALTMGARGGVYIAGGIVPRFLDFLKESKFRSRFEAKGRYQGYMAAIPTYVVLAEEPGLRGAAAALWSA